MKLKKEVFSALCNFGHRKRDISITITARSFKLRQLIEDNGENLGYNILFFFSSYCPLHFFELLPFANLDIENF